MKSICVYCGSSPGICPDYADAARALANALVKQKNITSAHTMNNRLRKKATHTVQIEGRQFIAHGVQSRFWQDIYHYAMTSTWPTFFSVFALMFIALNFIFACLYMMGDNAIANIYPNGFWGAFFFSVETIATVGYGDMHPQTVYGHIIATLEIFTGLSIVAMVTGVMFARFSRPKAKILFTRHPVTYRHNGEYVLSIRIANTRLTHLCHMAQQTSIKSIT